MTEIPQTVGPATPAPTPTPAPVRTLVDRIRAEIQRCVVGQTEVVDHVIAAFVAGGHVLLEGVPGVGKTMLVLAFARTFGGSASRIQFTPDLMPSDVTGHMLFDPSTGTFRVKQGPIFGHLIVADEINRAPAKTQAALLEVMQEGQVTIEGTAIDVPSPFMVVATQNPIEHEGTYPLPEAQLDRFLVKLHVEYPTLDDEVDIVQRVTTGHVGDALNVGAVSTVCSPQDAARMRDLAAAITVDARVVHYAVEIVRATRSTPHLSLGAGPRAAIALVRLGRALAVIRGRDFVTPDDVRDATLPVLRHRVALTPALEIEGVAADEVIARLVDAVVPPRQ